MLAERSPDEQSDVGPTLAFNVGPTELTTLSQRWPNVVMLSGKGMLNCDLWALIEFSCYLADIIKMLKFINGHDSDNYILYQVASTCHKDNS